MALKVTLGPVTAKGARALPPPDTTGGAPLFAMMAARTSERDYGTAPLTLPQVSQLLWAGQGVTHRRHDLPMRTAPSAGALYPMEIHLVAERVERLERGVWHYRPKHHDLERLGDGGVPGMARLCAHQDWIDEAPAVFVIAAVLARTAKKYGGRARQYALIEAGHIAQNMELAALSLGLGAAVVGAFKEEDLHRLAALPDDAEPLYVLTVGPPRDTEDPR